jgi:hypothetical protein
VLGASDPESESELSDLPQRAIYVSPMKVDKPRVTRRAVIYSTSWMFCSYARIQRAAARTANMGPQSSSPLLQMPVPAQTKVCSNTRFILH